MSVLSFKCTQILLESCTYNLLIFLTGTLFWLQMTVRNIGHAVEQKHPFLFPEFYSIINDTKNICYQYFSLYILFYLGATPGYIQGLCLVLSLEVSPVVF